MNWKLWLLLVVASIGVGMFVMSKIQPHPKPPVGITADSLARIQQHADSLALVAHRSDSVAAAEHAKAQHLGQVQGTLQSRVALLKDSLQRVLTRDDSLPVLVSVIAGQQCVIDTCNARVEHLELVVRADSLIKDQLIADHVDRARLFARDTLAKADSIAVLNKKLNHVNKWWVFPAPSRGVVFLSGAAVTAVLIAVVK